MSDESFEKDLKRLEEIVQALEEGELTLDDSLKQFEEGIKLQKRCEKALSQAEKKIEILLKNEEGEVVAEPFSAEEAAETDSPASDASAPPKRAGAKRRKPAEVKEQCKDEASAEAAQPGDEETSSGENADSEDELLF
jgi:exodeoxyribonuclease VII small subunit